MCRAQTFGLTLGETFKRASNPLRRYMFFHPVRLPVPVHGLCSYLPGSQHAECPRHNLPSVRTQAILRTNLLVASKKLQMPLVLKKL